MKNRLLPDLPLYASLALVAAAACGGEASPPGSGAGEPEPAIPANVVGTGPSSALGLPAVVTLEPESSAPPPAPDSVVMDQFGMAFTPRLLLVRAGQTVQFQNSEDIPHNVKVRSLEADSTLFNVSTLMGEPYVYTFQEPGGYAVSCDIHPGMKASLVVVDAPYAVAAAEDGTFSFSDVPPGPYKLSVWSADPALRSEQAVVVGPQGTVLTVDAAR